MELEGGGVIFIGKRWCVKCGVQNNLVVQNNEPLSALELIPAQFPLHYRIRQLMWPTRFLVANYCTVRWVISRSMADYQFGVKWSRPSRVAKVQNSGACVYSWSEQFWKAKEHRTAWIRTKHGDGERESRWRYLIDSTIVALVNIKPTESTKHFIMIQMRSSLLVYVGQEQSLR